MKTRILSLFLFLLTTLGASAADLVLAGQSYTLGNSTWFLTGDPAKPISTGTVRWDASTKTLTLDNVFIPQADGAGAVGLEINKSDFSRITIELKGFNRVLTTSYSAFRLGSPVTIKGDGSLTVGSSSKHAVEFIGKNVELRLEAPLNITMAGGITANTDKTCGIAVREGGELNFNQSANRKMAIEKLSYINLSDDFGYLKPRGAFFGSSGHLCNKDKNYVTGEEVRIAKAEYYGLKIGGTKVTSANYDLLDNWSFYYKNVKMTGVSFNYSSRTLNLNNATITTVKSSNPVIENDLTLTINCTGTNRFVYESEAKDNLGLKVNHELTFIGGGTLDMTNGSNYNYGGIYITESPTNFYNYANLKTPRVYSSKSGGVHMYCRDRWDNPRQTGTLTATGHPDGTFRGLMMGTIKAGYESGNFYSKFDNRLPFKTYAKKPVMYQYGNPDTSIYGVVDINKKYITGLVEYEGNQTIYPVEVAGYPVTSSNKNNMSNRYIGGTVSYEPSVTGNPVLNVDAWIEARIDAPAIKYTSGLEELLVKYDEQLRIDCEKGAEAVVSTGSIRFEEANANATIEVIGSVDSEDLEDRTGLFAVDNTLTFDNITKANVNSIEAGELNVSNSNLLVKHHLGKLNSHYDKWFHHGSYFQKGNIRDAEINTKNLRRAVYSKYYKGIMSTNSVKIDKAPEVTRYNVWVDGVQVTNFNCNFVVTEEDFHNNRDYEGFIEYFPNINELYFENVNLFDGLPQAPLVQFTGNETYTLYFAGKNKVDGNTMMGEGNLGIIVNGSTLKIKGEGSYTSYRNAHSLDVRMLRLENNAKVIFDKPEVENNKATVRTDVSWVESDESNTSMQVNYPPVYLSGNFYDIEGPTIKVKNLSVADGIVAVDENDDLLTIRSNGVYTSDNQQKSRRVKFIDKDKRVIKDTGLEFTKTSYKLTSIGQKQKLEYKVLPENATYQDVSFRSDNTDAVTVDKEGYVTAVENGKATITGTTLEGNTATCEVTVEIAKPAAILMQPETLTIDPTTPDQEYTVIAALGDNPFDDHRIDWTIEGNENLIEIVRTYSDYNRMEEWGYVGYLQVAVVKVKNSSTGIPAEGTCKLVATTPNGGPRGECVITLHQPVLAQRVVLIDKNGTSLDKVNIAGPGRYQNVTAKVYPENAENVTFQIVGNVTAGGVNSVAQMNRKDQGQPNEFTIVGIGEGYTRLGVYVKNGDAVLCSTFVDVTVKTPVPVEFVSVSIPEGDNKIMGIGNTLQLEVEIYPESADTLEVTWKSDDPSVATVDADGLVTAKSYGECNIIATSVAPGKKSDSEHIYVVDPDNYIIVPATGIALDRTAATSVPYGRVELEAILTPADANEYIEWHLYDSDGNEAGNCSYVSWLAPRDSRKCTVEASMTGTYTVVANVKDRNNVLATCRLTVRDEQIFYVQNAEGITVCYRETKIDDPENMQCEVFGNDSDPAVPDGVSGKLVIPSQVTYNGNTYNVKHITDEAFKRCNYLTEVVVSEGIETIGARAFMFDETTWAMPGEFFYANLQTVTLPASLKGLGEDCFTGQYSLTTVYMNCEEQPGSVYWGSSTVDDQMIYGAHPFDGISPDATLYIPDGTLETYYGLDIDKPWNRWFSHIEEMGSHDCYMYFTEKCPEGAEITYFSSNSASKKCVVMGKNEWGIIQPAVERNAEDRGVSEITIPEKVRGGEFTVIGIGVNAFNDVEGLETVRLPKTIQTLGMGAFWNCGSLTNVYLKNDYSPMFVDEEGRYIDETDYTWITSIFDCIGSNAVLHVPFGTADNWIYDPWPMWFQGGIVEEDVYFAEATTEGDDVSYRITSTKEMTCEVKANPETGSWAVGFDATEVEIPEIVDDYVVTGIGAEAFMAHSGLTKVTLPATIEYIGYSAFQTCMNLTDVYMLTETAPELLGSDGNPTYGGDNYAFSGLPGAMARSLDNSALSDGSATLHVPYGCIDEYNKQPWSMWFPNIVDDATAAPKKGDVNGDGVVNMADVTLLMSIITEGSYIQQADMNSDGKNDIADVLVTLNLIGK